MTPQNLGNDTIAVLEKDGLKYEAYLYEQYHDHGDIQFHDDSEDTLFLKRQILQSEVKEMVPYSKTIIDSPGVGKSSLDEMSLPQAPILHDDCDPSESTRAVGVISILQLKAVFCVKLDSQQEGFDFTMLKYCGDPRK
ncbi:predicted protein [Histoplasma capsulatum var. duboisii H88]|uniref:Predicted protein n=1 Tax=Ajellomyces capsulatus (strain H88) TaxID=544711 RepID=F0U7R0_AJEC8|nr:predicted protein [Histoplasma capsulatum var. duboisii H88]